MKYRKISDAEALSGGMSLFTSTSGFTLLPLYVLNALIPDAVARPLHGEVPAIDLVMTTEGFAAAGKNKERNGRRLAC